VDRNQRIKGTVRLQAFSDGVIAIIITLLIFEVRVPVLEESSTQGVLRALLGIIPKIISFAISFFTVAIFWVNHHHIFMSVAHTNWKLLWYNNALLFWLAVVPFTTAFIGDHPNLPAVVSLYALVLFLAAFSFSLMFHYVFFRSDLALESVPLSERRREWNRGCWAFGLYGAASLMAFVYVYAALVITAVIPFLFVVPKVVRRSKD
jgi:TMEM175 potassium channel family protein